MTQEQRMEQLKKLKRDADNAIGRVQSMRKRPDGSVNWADISCCEAAYILADDGREYLRITIEEASPEATEFVKAVRAEMDNRGWSSYDLEVVAEW